MWYSFDLGPVHFISYSSEVFFCGKSLFGSNPCENTAQRRMLDWIRQDLVSVDRAKTPWIIAYAHRPMYCSNDDCTEGESGKVREPLEKLFAGVDLILQGHAHSYERMWPTLNHEVHEKIR